MMVTASDLQPLYRKAKNVRRTRRLVTHFSQLRSSRTPFHLTGPEVERIVRWKLGDQYDRTARHRAWNTDAICRTVTHAAFSIRSRSRLHALRVRTAVLTALPGVGVPVASAMLAVCEPERFGIIDFRVWRQVFGEPKQSFTLKDYGRYMQVVWRLSRELGWSAQDVDLAIWERDRQMFGGASE